ncbi:hypothetical protein [Roseobacter sp.]|uniref:hypothetical protein n=1 Tax=Roseobacter sp. TaxID=1907202 RepID=UPI00329A3BF0
MGHFLKETSREIAPQCSKYRIFAIPVRQINQYFNPIMDVAHVEYHSVYCPGLAAMHMDHHDRIGSKLNRGRPVIAGKTGGPDDSGCRL